jgi:hypothetical protein
VTAPPSPALVQDVTAPPSPALVQNDAAPVIDGLLTSAESIVDPFPSPATNQQTLEVPESVDWASINQNVSYFAYVMLVHISSAAVTLLKKAFLKSESWIE